MSKEKPERNIWNAQHMMIDIETIGGSPSESPILSIAAAKFNPHASIEDNIIDDVYFQLDYVNMPKGIYYNVMNLDEQLSRGRKIDIATLQWWTDSPEKSEIFHHMLKRQESLKKDRVRFLDQLVSFGYWVKEVTLGEYTYVWAYGNSFDMAFLEHVYKEYSLEFPFHYQGYMDARTLCQVYELSTCANFPFVKDKQSHHALADVRKQIKYVKEAVRFLSK